MNTAQHLIATVSNNVNLEKYADCVNAGRTDNISFYVNDGRVSVSYLYGELTVERQTSLLEWFCGINIVSIK
jgi:hypothetical protein